MPVTQTARLPHRSETHSIELFLQSDPLRIRQYREQAREFLARYLRTPTHVEDMEVIIDEALTNIVQHSCSAAPDQVFQMKLMLETLNGGLLSLLSVNFIDQGSRGQYYNPAEHVVETRRRHEVGEPAGFGLVLLYQLMDQVDYVVSEHGTNRLTLRKWFCHDEAQIDSLRRLLSEMQSLESGPMTERGSMAALWRNRAPHEALELVSYIEGLLGSPTPA